MAGSEQKEKIIRYYKGTEGADTAIKLVDMAEQVMRSQKFRISGFLDLYGQEIAETVVANYPGIRLEFNGGYQGAERQRAMFIDETFGTGTHIFLRAQPTNPSTRPFSCPCPGLQNTASKP